jgi:UDP-N-acetyl-D-mannosaminuronic acid dehydrogenase
MEYSIKTVCVVGLGYIGLPTPATLAGRGVDVIGVGGMTEACAKHAEAVYRIFLQGRMFRTDAPTAGLVKLVENAFRDVKIAFANELSQICDQLGLNVWEVIELANRHPRVAILQPGAGVGGHCIAVDPWFIVALAPERTRLIRTAREVNDTKPKFVVSQIRERAERFKRPVITCLGLTYKPDVDDLRESPAIEIVSQLAATGSEQILVADPHLNELPPALATLPTVLFCDPACGQAIGHCCGPGGSLAVPEDLARRADASCGHRRDRSDPR